MKIDKRVVGKGKDDAVLLLNDVKSNFAIINIEQRAVFKLMNSNQTKPVVKRCCNFLHT